MQHLKTILAAALALALAACSSETIDFVGGTPDVQGLTLESTGGTTDATSYALRTSTVQSALVGAACQDYQYLCKIQEGVAELNLYVHATLGPVAQLVQLRPAEPSADVREFGPADLTVWNQTSPVATFKLTVKHVVNQQYRWMLQAKPLGAPDLSYRIVLAGELWVGDRPHRGHGVLGVNLDNLYAANPVVFTGRGKLLAGFAHRGDEKALAYVLKDFQADATSEFIPGAIFVGHKLASGETRVRLALAKDVVAAPDTSSVPELFLARARWVPGVGGRAAVGITSSDIRQYNTSMFTGDALTTPPPTDFPIGFLLGVSCFKPADALVGAEGFHDLLACTLTPPAGNDYCYEVPYANLPSAGYRSGDIGACVAGTELTVASDPTVDASSTAPEPGAPATPDAPPSDVPTL